MVHPKSLDSEPDPTLPNGTLIMRNAVRQAYLRWPQGRVPYTVSTQYTSFGWVRVGGGSP